MLCTLHGDGDGDGDLGIFKIYLIGTLENIHGSRQNFQDYTYLERCYKYFFQG